MGGFFVLRDDPDSDRRFLDIFTWSLYHVYLKVLQVLQIGGCLAEQSVRTGIQIDG